MDPRCLERDRDHFPVPCSFPSLDRSQKLTIIRIEAGRRSQADFLCFFDDILDEYNCSHDWKKNPENL